MEFTGVVQRLREGGGHFFGLYILKLVLITKTCSCHFLFIWIYLANQTRTPYLCLIAIGLSGALVKI